MTLARLLIGAGVVVLVVSVMTAPAWLGPHPGVWLQEVGIVVGIVAIAAGFYLRGRPARCHWVVICSCGFERACTSLWTATAAADLHIEHLGGDSVEHTATIKRIDDQETRA